MLAWIETGPGPGRGRWVAAGPLGRALLRVGAGGAMGVGLSLACNSLACNVEPGQTPQFAAHCADDFGDATCALAHPNKPFCNLCVPVEQDEGCVGSPPVPACRYGGGPTPGDDGATGNDDGSGSTGTDSGGTDTTSSGADTLAADDTASSGTDTEVGVPCTEEGTLDRECASQDPEHPFCIDGLCADCTAGGGDAFCGAVNDVTPACDAALGVCVACSAAARPVCGESTPICDADGGACIACTEHAQCAGAACHRSSQDPQQGACFAPEEVVWVDGTANCPGSGTEASPYCSLQDTVDAVQAGDNLAIFLLAGDPYAEDITLGVAATVAIRGVGSPSLISNPGTSQPSVRVHSGGVMYLSNVRIIGNPNLDAIACDEAAVIVSDAEIASNGRWGIYVTSPCAIDLRRTTLHHNAVGGIRMLGGHLALDNATVAVNGNGAAGPGIQLLHADIDMIYSTIAGNNGFGPDSLQCEGVVAGTVRNSILDGVDAQSIDLDCFALAFDNNAVNSTAFGNGTNAQIGPYVAAYFTDPTDGDFRLAAPPLTPYGGVAQWQLGDPPVDADGTERPTDAAGYAGIDEP